jgi:hypothetical protein
MINNFAAITVTEENTEPSPYASRATDPPIYVGSGKLNFIEAGNLVSINHAFEKSGEPTMANWQDRIDELEARGGFGTTIKSVVATNGQTYITANQRVDSSWSYSEYWMKFSSFIDLVVIKGGEKKVYQINGGTVYVSKRGLEANSSVKTYTLIDIATYKNTFYLSLFEETVQVHSSIYGDTWTTSSMRIGVRTSTDGITWSAFNPKTPDMVNGINHMKSNPMVSSSRAKVAGNTLYFYIPKSDEFAVMDSVDRGGYIGYFDNIEWYNRDGEMLLCAVRVDSEGCYGKILCGEDGLLRNEPWRKVPDWVPSMNRIDALYVA